MWLFCGGQILVEFLFIYLFLINFHRAPDKTRKQRHLSFGLGYQSKHHEHSHEPTLRHTHTHTHTHNNIDINPFSLMEKATCVKLPGDDITSNGYIIPDYTLHNRPTKD